MVRVAMALFSLSVSLFADELLIDHVQENLGISLEIPPSWDSKAFVRGKSEFFPTPTAGAFVEVSLLEPQGEDYSTVDLEFFIYDLMHLSDQDQKIQAFEYHQATLNDLPAYDVSYDIKREKDFRVRMFFTSANEKIYMIRYQALKEDFDEYETLFVEKIVPSFKIQVIRQAEMRYQFFEVPKFGFSFYYPASWRVVETEYSTRPMPVYSDPQTGVQTFLSSSVSSSGFHRAPRFAYAEGVALGSDDPVLIAPDSDTFVTVTVIGLAYKFEAADAIEGFVKTIRENAKELDGFQHLRQFPIQIDGGLAMEYSYSYREEKDGKETKYYLTHYITYANERLYQIRYGSTEENFSKHVKEVERLVKYFKFRKM